MRIKPVNVKLKGFASLILAIVEDRGLPVAVVMLSVGELYRDTKSGYVEELIHFD
jgi:hypothetical protein